MNMAVPPFPSQALAKLVLGYLAEEQLMTAYDEFLQASPYLDALENEYDRVLMTSLRCMLAEYRAVKIYVETCKPVVLRRMLFQCSNLLEIVKFLIENIDVSKIQCRDSTNSSAVKQSSRIAKKFCDECDSFSFQNCHCNKTSMEINLDAPSIRNSVETTSLKDLPGHQSQIGKDQNEDKIPHVSSKDLSIKGSYCVESINIEASNHNNGGSIQLQGETKVCRKPEHHTEIMNMNQDLQHNHVGLSATEGRMSKSGTFQDFSTGISGADNGNISVPDSSTSENVQINSTKVSNSLQSITVGCSKVTENVTTRYLVIDQNNIASVNNNDNIGKTTPITNKAIEQKITILSDVKVDPNGKRSKMPKVLKNATSTPMLQMQTIFINGIPAYRQDQAMKPSSNYTKDEIMSMPTIIVAPTSTGSIISTSAASLPTTTVSESCKSLGPLVLDLLSIESSPETGQNDKSNVINQPPLGLVTTVDFHKKNPSVPKDNIIISPHKVNTPQHLPVLRKASSTPRRSTHVRVLDFATPRRILHEVISENGNDNKNEGTVEVILSRSPNLAGASLNVLDSSITADPKTQDVSTKENTKTKINSTSTNKKRDWDADLRALASLVTPISENDKLKQTKSKPIKTKNKKPTDKVSRKSDSKRGRRKSAKAVKSADSAIVEIIDDDEPVKEDEIILAATKRLSKTSEANLIKTSIANTESVVHKIKPTINIISRDDKGSMLPPETSNKKDKSTEGIPKKDISNDDLTDTPEAERLSLQNVIGAKLNISDFLETPYKQALYDIQMETPRFLGPDLPGDPLSDIKIMNIPTPRFLNSPNTQATPSSYSSRPTDYSSGGSYYKPDDQDYIPSADLLGYPSSTKKYPSELELIQENSVSEKSRPVRKCTKNVSYYSGKQKESEESEQNKITERLKSILSDNKVSKPPTKTKEKSSDKATSKKADTSKGNAVKKRRTPIKKDKSFMKIKPRKCSPVKTPKSKRKSVGSAAKSPANKKSLSNENDAPSDTITAGPTKSRRKSSTPRKLNCTKPFVSDSSNHDSPEMDSKDKHEPTLETSSNPAQDSDTEHIALLWSDDCSQDAKLKVDQSSETDDITKIREFIAITKSESHANLHLDLMNRGFDAETAKRIERDLLDAPEQKDDKQNTLDQKDSDQKTAVDIEPDKRCQEQKNLESDCSNNLLIDTNEDEVEEIELSIHECYEESNNYISIQYNEESEPQTKEVQTLKDKFSMEICLDDDVTVRLRATPFTILVDQNEDENYRETQLAVSSISNFDKLYTPLKDAVRAKCSEIFDSTLTSLDTPLKAPSPTRNINLDTTVTDIVLQVEKIEETVEVIGKIELKQKVEVKEKSDSKKRKRGQSGASVDESTNSSKKPKPETQYLLNSANIQNIDIESVLKQLHGS